ncbi:MAG TPA: helix-turn-helix domain-containing protein [Thermodesulfobacteriota bacterium]
MEKPNEGLTSKQLAQVLPFAISPDEINYLARRNKIPAEKRGKMWIYKKKDLNKILKTLSTLNA